MKFEREMKKSGQAKWSESCKKRNHKEIADEHHRALARKTGALENCERQLKRSKTSTNTALSFCTNQLVLLT